MAGEGRSSQWPGYRRSQVDGGAQKFGSVLGWVGGEVVFARRERVAWARRGICECRMEREKSVSSSMMRAVEWVVERNLGRD